MPKSSIARRTPSAFSSCSRSTARSVSAIITVSVISRTSDDAGKPARLERVPHVVDDRLRLELLDREVDADRQRRASRERLVQANAFATGLLEDPAADRDDQAGLLGERNELQSAGSSRASGASSGGAPRRRRSSSLVEADDRLVVDLELVQLERVLELGLQLEPFDDALVHRRLEDAVAALAVALRHVHRDVGVSEQLLRVGGARRRRPARQMPTLARGIDVLAVDLELELERAKDPSLRRPPPPPSP